MNFNFANITRLNAQFLKKWKWVLLGCFSLILREVLDYTPQYVEQFYSRGLFSSIRFMFDNSLGLFPIPWIFIFYIAAFIALFKALKPLFNKTLNWKKRLGNTAFSLLSLIGFLLFWFFTLWGYNYARPTFAQQLAIKIEKPDSLARAVSTYTHLRNALFHNSALSKVINLNGKNTELKLIDFFYNIEQLVTLTIMKAVNFDDNQDRKSVV